MHLFTRWFKPSLYNQGAAPTLADGSARIRQERVQLAASVIRAHDLFGLRDDMTERMKDDAFKKSFGKRLRSLLNTSDKVAFYSNDFAADSVARDDDCACGRRTGNLLER